MFQLPRVLPVTFALVSALLACDETSSPNPTSGRFEITTAPLSLPGVHNVCYDLRVSNGASQVVFQKGNPLAPAWSSGVASDTDTLCSQKYGNGSAGDITFIGACDASAGMANHTVTLWIDGLYDASNGSLPFQNPCASGCNVTAACVENSDTPVTFDITVARPANQGFFDIAVEFDDVFCSAKYDCQTRDLLFQASGQRGPTQVLGLACTAGKPNVDTVVYMTDLLVTCGTGIVTIDPSGPSGNLCSTPGDLSTCTGVTTSGTFATSPLFQVAIYHQTISPSDPTTGRSWNLALGVVPAALSGCQLTLRATADNHDDPGGAQNGSIPPGLIYPEINFDVSLGSCATNQPLDGPGSSVTTHYVGPSGTTTYANAYPAEEVELDVVDCTTGNVDNLGTYSICEGEDWTLPASVTNSPAGTVSTYTSEVKDDVTRNLSGGGYNPFSRRLTGFDGTTNLCMMDASALATNDIASAGAGVSGNGIPNSWESLVDNMQSVDCAEYQIEQKIKSLIAAGTCTASDPYLNCRATARTSLQTSGSISAYTLGSSTRYKCNSTLTAAFVKRHINFNLWGQTTGNIDTGCTFTPTSSVGSLGSTIESFLYNGFDSVCVAGSPNAAYNSKSGWAELGPKVCGSSSVLLEQRFTQNADYADPDFFSSLSSRLDSFGDAFALLGSESTERFAGVLSTVTLNGEDGHLPYFEDWGFILPASAGGSPYATTESLASLYDDMAGTLIAEGFTPSMLRINLAQGGAIFKAQLSLAAMGSDGIANGGTDAYAIGAHGPSALLTYRFLQQLDVNLYPDWGHIEYDTARRGFRAKTAHRFGGLYTDLENLDATTHTAGQYRMFRITALAAVALGFDAVLVTGQTLPSLGLAQTYAGANCPGSRWCNYNHTAAADQGGVDFLAWLRKSIGRSGSNRVEAWCWLGELGSEPSPTDGLAFYSRAAASRAADSRERYGAVADASLFRPVQRYFGAGCDLSSADFGTPTLPLSPARIGVSADNKLAQNGQGANFAHREWTGLNQTAADYSGSGSVSSWLATLATLTWPYEARSPATGSKIRLDLDPTIIGTATSADVFVVFEKVGLTRFSINLKSDGVAWTNPGEMTTPVADDLQHTARIRVTRSTGTLASAMTLDLTEVAGDFRIKLVRVVPL